MMVQAWKGWVKSRKTKRKDTKLPQTSVPKENIADKAVNKEMYDSLERATTTDASLDAEQDRGIMFKTQSKATPNEPSSIRTSSGGGPRRQNTIGDTIAQTRSKNVSKFSNDLLLARVNTPRSGKDSLTLKELMKFYTNLQDRVIDLETTKITQALEIDSVKKRVKKLKKKKKSGTHKLKRLYKEDASKHERIADIDADEGLTLVNETFKDQERHNDEDMFDTHGVTAKILTIDEVTLAEALIQIKSAKPKTAATTPKARGIVFQEPDESTPTLTVSIQ
nr:hypothetical protein [Tanacetum cinerariifolium]